MPSPSRASSPQVRCAGMRPSRTPPLSSTTSSESLQFLILGVTSLLMLIQVRSAARPSALVMQARESARQRPSYRPALHAGDSVSVKSWAKATRKAVALRRMLCRRDPMMTLLRAPQVSSFRQHPKHSPHRRRPSMSLAPSRRSPSVAPQILSPKRALRVMKGKHVENAETLPSSATARVSSAIRAVGRVDVARVNLPTASPIGGTSWQ